MALFQRSSRLAVAVASVLVVGATAACGDGSSPRASDPVVRDSAGVAIVEHPAGLPDEPAWTVDMGEAVHLTGDFFQVVGAFSLSDGRIVVGNGGSREVRFYGADGSLERTVGREGEGPGEFRSMSVVRPWPGDSVFVYDWQLRRATLLDSWGELGRTFSLAVSDEVPFANVRGVHADGSMMATGFAQMGGEVPSGRIRVPSPAYRFHPDGSLFGIHPVEPSSEGYYEALDGGFRVRTPLFARSTHLLAGPEILVEASNDSWEIRIREPTGELVRIVRRAFRPAQVTDALRREAIEREVTRVSGEAEGDELRRTLQGMPVPDRVPAFAMVTVDRRNRIWVAEWGPEARGRDASWTVLGPDGEVVARARTPGGLTPQEIGSDYIVGVVRDDLDVERVVRVPLG